MNILQKTLTATAFLSVAVTGIQTASHATNETNLSNRVAQANTQLAQAPVADSCREVATQSRSLNVRATPNGRIIGSVPRGSTVSINSRGGDWVPISAPVNGYVASRYLAYCGDTPPVATQPVAPAPVVTQPVAPAPTQTQTANLEPTFGNSCRRISQGRATAIHDEPAQNASVLRNLSAGQQIAIANLGSNGWVRITTPIDGYVQARFLTSC